MAQGSPNVCKTVVVSHVCTLVSAEWENEAFKPVQRHDFSTIVLSARGLTLPYSEFYDYCYYCDDPMWHVASAEGQLMNDFGMWLRIRPDYPTRHTLTSVVERYTA